MTAAHIKVLFMALTENLANFADRLENSMSGLVWSDDTTFWAANTIKSSGLGSQLSAPIEGLNIGRFLMIIDY